MSVIRKKVFLILLLITSLTSACGPVTPYVSSDLLSSTITPIPPTGTPIPSEAYVKLNKPSNIYDPKDPSLPDLIISENDVMHLDLEWDVAQIEYSYDWWGLSEPQLGYELIRLGQSNYLWNEKVVSSERVNNFLSSITNLHPVQSLLVGIFHTDDYPTWQVELTGVDGNHILIYAASNENPGYGPWHVIYNGRMYAQYDGSIGPAIGELFDREDDAFVWQADFPEYHSDNVVGFATEGWPNQLWNGYEGLLPVSQGFSYQIDPESSKLEGYVRGRYSIGGFGNMIVGKIVSLNSVVVEFEEKKQSCKIEEIVNADEYSEQWLFSCDIPDKKTGERYRLPIAMELGLDNGQSFTSKGTLYGLWENLGNFWVIPPAEEIHAAINENMDAKAVFDKTTIYVSSYTGKLELNVNEEIDLSGQFIILGEAEINGVNVKYSVFTPFAVKDRRFIEFGLNEQELKRFLFDTFYSPVTQRMLAVNPDVMLNLWYAKLSQPSIEEDFPLLWNGSNVNTGLEATVSSCGDVEAAVFPSAGKPYRRFAFNSNYLWYPWRSGIMNEISFMLVENDKAIVERIYLYGGWNKTGVVELDEQWQYLLPSQLNIPNVEPFNQITYSSAGNQLAALFGIETPMDEMKTYKRFLDLLPGNIVGEKGGYSVDNIGLVVAEDGSVMAIPCQ
jgi:hypothetical protein